MRNLPLVLLLIGLIFWLPACTPVPREYSSLANQGILALSTTNPYLGANLYLAHEFSRSSFLFNFLKSKGAPVAIEIEEPQFGAPRLIMYYPRERETYAADMMQYTSQYDPNAIQWVVRGPFAIERLDLHALQRLDTAMVGEPVFNYLGKQFRFRFEPPPVSLQPNIPQQPKPSTTPKPRPKTKTAEKAEQGAIITKKGSEPTEFKPLNSDQQALAISQGLAERATNGDVVHTVRRDGETLTEISKWFTGSESNAAAIAASSSLPTDQALKAGARITVPRNLVKEVRSMPPAAAAQ